MMRTITTCAMTAMCFAISACAMTSDVMDTGNGTYMISARAAPIRGGTVGANNVAYQDANKFCAERQPGTHAIVVDAAERDVYQGASSGAFSGNRSGFSGGFGGGVFAAGNANLRFRCGA